MVFNMERALAHYEEQQNFTDAAKLTCAQQGMPYEKKYMQKLRRLVIANNEADEESDRKSEINSIEVNEEEGYEYSHADDKKPESYNMPSAWAEHLDRFYTIDEYCDRYGLEKEKVKNSRLVAHVRGHMIYNIGFYNPEEEAVVDLQDHLDEIIAKHSTSKDYEFIPSPGNTISVTNLTITDAHVGMDPNKGGNSLYGGKWDRVELFNRLDFIVDLTVKKSRLEGSKVLYVRELGDLADGLNAETTRGGHKLPQNMSNVEVYDAALEWKIELVDRLLQSGTYEKIIMHNVCNSNHGGDFDYFINKAFKGIIETKYGTDLVEVHNHRKFIFHYGVGDHCFILSHGKDDEDMKFGLKPILDFKAADKIDQYLKANNLYQEYKYFHFCKGDSHQFMLDFTTSSDFNYLNYPALSPSSKWVQGNFKKGMSGFVVEVFHPSEPELDIKYKEFDWVN